MNLALAGLAMALASGCRVARKRVDSDILRSVSFDYEDGTSPLMYAFRDDPPGVLRVQMEQASSPIGSVLTPMFNRLGTPQLFKTGALERDAYRLEVWYAHNGWFDARFKGWEIAEIRPARGNSVGVYDVIGHIDAGPASTVRRLNVIGYDAHVQDVVNIVLGGIGLKKGDRFSLDAIKRGERDMSAQLQERGFAYANATVVATAHPDELAVDVTMAVDMGSGTPVQFGEVTFIGTEKTPEKTLRNMMPFKAGETYGLSKLEKARKRIFGTGAYSIVNIKPDLSVRGAKLVPVLVEVVETRFHTLRIGAGVDYDGYRINPRLSLSYRDVNLFKQLVRLDARGALGYSSIAGEFLQEGLEGVTDNILVDVNLGLTWPQLIAKNVDVSTRVSYQRALQGGQFLFEKPEVDLGVIVRFSEVTALTFGPHWESYTMPNLRPEVDPTQAAVGRALFGADFDGSFQLTSIDARFTVDLRDDKVSTSEGSYWNLAVRQAVPFSEDDFFYTDISAEVRGYAPVFAESNAFKFIAVGRLKGRYLQPYGQSKLPYPERVFTGGVQDIRGFRDGFVGPYDALCLYQADAEHPDRFTGLQREGLEVTQRYLPRGGVAGVTATLEARKTLLPSYGIGASVFADGGFLVYQQETADQMALLPRWSAGFGLRYESLIGPIRLDLAFRPGAPEDKHPGIGDQHQDSYIDCKGPDKTPRSYSLVTIEGDPSDTVIQLFLSIGDPL